MGDIGYGIQAINHRYKVLGGKPKVIADDNKLDLADKLKVIFGDNYIGHPRLKKLIIKNAISDKDFLNGIEETVTFEIIFNY